jgi:pantetheine-phosphate adenylyltransferase
VRRAAALYDRVIVAVMVNDSKNYLFTLAQRKKIAAAAFAGEPKIEVISSDGMLWQSPERRARCAIVKGWRDARDYEYEVEMAKFNEAHCPEAKTVLLKADEKYKNLSSTAVRERIKNNLGLTGYVPEKIG